MEKQDITEIPIEIFGEEEEKFDFKERCLYWLNMKKEHDAREELRFVEHF